MKCPKCQFENPPESTYCGKCATRIRGHVPAPGEPGTCPQERGEHGESYPAFTETMDTAREELTTGSTFAGRYQVIEELGAGGMGRVYKVLDTKLGEKIALKLLRPETILDRKSLERFSNELKLARKIRHKNVCQMFDLGEDQGTRYITMEYVRGEDLRQLIRKVGRLSPGQAVAVARQVCDGLAEAHKLGVVHRDLKPQNVMLDEDGNARIMDFGIARSLSGKGITGAGTFIGTPEYMSPEQVEGKDVGERSDIYSLGVILYEMVTGRRPFDGETALSIAHKHKYETPEDPRKLVAEVPDSLARVILKCLEKDKAARYESAQALDADLAGIDEGLPTTEKALPKRKGVTTKDITVTFNLRKLVVPAVAVLGMVAAVIILVKVIGKKPVSFAAPASGKPSVAVMYFENQTERPGLDKMAVTLLTTNLSRNEDIEVTSTQRLFDILKLLGKQDAQTIDRSLATEVATRAGVKTMLLGSIIQIGERIRLSSELIDVKSGSIVGTQTEDGTKYDDLFAMVDGITEQVGKQVGGGKTAGGLKVADVTTSSLEALEHYQKACDLMLRWDYPAAAKLLLKAVEIDPGFAMAYAYLAMAQLGNPSAMVDLYTDLTEARNTLESAKKHSDRATASERITIQMIEAMLNRDMTKAEGFGRDLLARNIPEKWAYFSIMMSQWFKRDFRGAIQTAEKVLENDPAEGNAYNMIAYGYGHLNDYPAAISALKKYIAVHPDVSNAYDSAWEMSMWGGLYDEAVRYADEALRTHPGWVSFDWRAGWGLIHKGQGEAARERFRRLERNSPASGPSVAFYLGLSYLSEGRHREAEAEFLRSLGLSQETSQKYFEIWSRIYLGEELMIQGHAGQAFAQFEEAEKASAEYYKHDFNPVPLTRRLYAGRAFLRQGQIDRAVSQAEEISRIIERQDLPAAYLDFRHLLEAEISLAKNEPEDALRNLDQAGFHAWRSSPHYWRTRAAAEEALGRFGPAVESYRKFLGFITIARGTLGDPVRYFYELSMADYNLGRIAEKTNDAAAAKDHYRKFLEGMRAADPGIPEVADAQKRFSALK
ncbi:MAG: protein kinase [Candidatus Aminicenantes bacterium]|nr:protein kinase [Candidatus Aminicenantes bacterium]